MSKIVFCFPRLNNSHVLQHWVNCFNNLHKEMSCEIYILVENQGDIIPFQSLSQNTLKFICIDESLNDIKKYTFSAKEEISNKYFKHNLGKLRLKSFTPFTPALLEQYDFDDLLCSRIKYFESILSNYNIDIVFLMEPSSTIYFSDEIILEAVCDQLNKTILFIHKSGVWNAVGIFDNLHRSSKKLEQCYKKKLRSGISESEKRRVKDYFLAYQKYKNSKVVQQYWANKIVDNNNLLNRLKNSVATVFGLKQRIRKSFGQNKSFLKKRQDVFDTNNRKYVLFLLGKINNKRAEYLAPFYNDPILLIQNISISLPMTHSLVIKEHPLNRYNHSAVISSNQWLFENDIQHLSNCYYVGSKNDTFEIVENADVVFSIASSSAVEALTKIKHVVFFGENSFVFGKYDAPIKRITNLEDLPRIIQECINKPPPVEKIYAYFYALLTYTYRWGDIPDQNWWNISEEGFYDKMAKLIQVGIKEHT